MNCCKKENFHAFNQVRFIPKHGFMIAEVVYSISICEAKADNQRYCSIDIGIDNLAEVTTNAGYRTCIINGRGLKSVNKYYREVAKRMNGMDFTKRMGKITAKRNWKINDYMHTIVIGYNKDWKRELKLSKNVNQSFAGIPTQRLIV